MVLLVCTVMINCICRKVNYKTNSRPNH